MELVPPSNSTHIKPIAALLPITSEDPNDSQNTDYTESQRVVNNYIFHECETHILSNGPRTGHQPNKN